MNIKIFRYIFILTIAILVIAGIYIIYIKDNGKINDSDKKNPKSQISKEIIIGVAGLDTINPIKTKSLEMQHLGKLVYEPLVNITKDFNVEPCIASQWSKINELTYIVTLNKDKKWANGETIKVKDIEYTIKAINEEDSIYKENIKPIERIEEITEDTFKIYLKESVNFFEYFLCFPIIEETTYNKPIPMGTGEYKITEILDNQTTIKGKETKIIIKNFESGTELYNKFSKGEIDLIITQNFNYEEYIGNIGFEEHIITGREFYYLSCENIKDKETRKTIESSINKEKIIYDLYNRKYKTVNFPLEYGSYLNIEKTKEKDQNKKIKKALTISTSYKNKKIAEKIKENLEEKNIKAYILGYETKTADLILKKNTVPITPEITEYFDKEENAEIIKVMNIENKEVLKEEYSKIIRNYYEESPFISLFFDSYIILHTDKLKGDFSGNWYNFFYNIDTWYKI